MLPPGSTFKVLCDALPPLHFVTATLPKETQTNPILANMQWIWKRISIKLKFNLHLNLSAYIWLNPKLKIDKKPFLWKEWVEKGITLLGDLYEDVTVKSFTELKQQYGLSQHQIWSYFQIRHLLTQTFGSASITPPSSDVLSKVIKVFGTGHEASKYYRLLLKNFISNTSGLKSAWETDINLTFTDEEWENISKNCRKMSGELRTRLVQFKIINRVYWSPLKLHRAKLRDSPNCWRYGGNVGTLLHMLWSCLATQIFWFNIYDNIKLILESDFPFCPSLFVLGDPLPLKDVPSAQAEWVQSALMLGRKLIVKEWKATSLPSVRVWFSQLGIVAVSASEPMFFILFIYFYYIYIYLFFYFIFFTFFKLFLFVCLLLLQCVGVFRGWGCVCVWVSEKEKKDGLLHL